MRTSLVAVIVCIGCGPLVVIEDDAGCEDPKPACAARDRRIEQTSPLYDSAGGPHWESEVVASAGQTYRQVVIVPDGARVTDVSIAIEPGDRDTEHVQGTAPATLSLSRTLVSGESAEPSFIAGVIDPTREVDYLAPHELTLCVDEAYEPMSSFLYIAYTHEHGSWVSDGVIHRPMVSYTFE